MLNFKAKTINKKKKKTLHEDIALAEESIEEQEQCHHKWVFLIDTLTNSKQNEQALYDSLCNINIEFDKGQIPTYEFINSFDSDLITFLFQLIILRSIPVKVKSIGTLSRLIIHYKDSVLMKFPPEYLQILHQILSNPLLQGESQYILLSYNTYHFIWMLSTFPQMREFILNSPIIELSLNYLNYYLLRMNEIQSQDDVDTFIRTIKDLLTIYTSYIQIGFKKEILSQKRLLTLIKQLYKLNDETIINISSQTLKRIFWEKPKIIEEKIFKYGIIDEILDSLYNYCNYRSLDIITELLLSEITEYKRILISKIDLPFIIQMLSNPNMDDKTFESLLLLLTYYIDAFGALPPNFPVDHVLNIIKMTFDNIEKSNSIHEHCAYLFLHILDGLDPAQLGNLFPNQFWDLFIDILLSSQEITIEKAIQTFKCLLKKCSFNYRETYFFGNSVINFLDEVGFNPNFVETVDRIKENYYKEQ